MSEFAPQLENEPRPRFKELLEKYIAGDSHIHSVLSNPETRHEADYTPEQILSYLRNEIDKGTNKAQFVILAEHASDAAHPELVDGQALLENQRQIDVFNSKLESVGQQYPRAINGVEASIISVDGEVDVPDEILEQLDCVIASKHDLSKVLPESSRGNPNAEEMTQMYLGLIENENIDVIGHPNRLGDYTAKEVLTDIDWDMLLTKAKETHTAFEININAPMPKWLIEKIVGEGVPIFIGTDMHTLAQYQ